MMPTAKLLQNEFIASGVRELILEPQQSFAFKPGQYITILVPTAEGKSLGRSYSLASWAGEKNIRLIIKLVPGGLASTYVDQKVQVGDTISFVGPVGRFLLSSLPQDFLFVATGAGLAPFVCMIDNLLTQNTDKKITLLFGVRHQEDLFYVDHLAQWQKQHSNFQAICTLSQPTETWTGPKGRVTEYLLEHPEILQNKQVYICGNGSMINDVQKICLEKGLTKEQIFFEKYNNL